MTTKNTSNIAQSSNAQLISEYGTILQNNKRTVLDSALLPAPAEKIGQALLAVLTQTQDTHQKEALRVAFIELASFLPLSQSEKLAVANWEQGQRPTDAQGLIDLAKKLGDFGNVYADLQTKVLEQQAALLNVLHRFEDSVRKNTV
jgi:hypothetical protein